MKQCVMYLLTGPAHLPNLAVSLRSLRRVWDGDVLVWAWPESANIARQISNDPEINAEFVPCDFHYKRRNAQEMAKISYLQGEKMRAYDIVTYIDADTIIKKPITELFDVAKCNQVNFAATQFCDWFMDSGIARNRVSRLFGIDGIDQDCVRRSLAQSCYSYNSGIFACAPTSPVLPVWGEWTTLSKGVFISGESSLHPIAQKFPIATLPHGVYNCSTMEKFQSRVLKDEDVAIWHFHGDSNIRPAKSPRGFAFWWPEFQAALSDNLGGMQAWIDSIPNPFLQDLIRSKS